MASVNGDWFHSRISSNLSELLTIRKALFESQKLEYIGINWKGNNAKMEAFAYKIGIADSQLRTKTRAMIRNGFIQDDDFCPLKWTKYGEIWNDLYTNGSYEDAKKLYELILIVSLAIYAFNDKNYTTNPSKGELPLKTLFNLLDNEQAISIKSFSILVDGNKTGTAKNVTYWRADLVNTGLFVEKDKKLIYTGKYLELVNIIKNFVPNSILIDADWNTIRENPILSISPFSDFFKNAFLEIIQNNEKESEKENEKLITNLIDYLAEEENNSLPEIDILSNNTKFVQTNRRVRNATWSLRIKQKYGFRCAMPDCDAEGQFLVEAAHIKPDNAQDGQVPHRTHILNGLCLCRNCHLLFDRGYFSIADDTKVITSSILSNIKEQHLKKVIVNSANNELKLRIDNRKPLSEFLAYHREVVFMV